MSPLRRHALEVAEAALRTRPGLRSLAPEDRRAVEALATSIAMRVAEAIDAVYAEVGAVPTRPAGRSG
jgi:hypothetical protein